MIYTELTKKALKLAYKHHKNDLDKGRIPYVYHLYHIASLMDSEYSVCVALLHDIIEFKHLTLKDLQREFPFPVTEAIRLLTSDDTLSYPDYIRRIKTSEIATKVKIEDLKHNLDMTRLDKVSKEDNLRKEKYEFALRVLESE